MKHISKNVLIVFAVALLIRIVLIIFTSQSLKEHGDMYLHRDWGKVAFLYGPAETYNKEHISDVGAVNNLPPGATYLFGSAYFASIQASKLIVNVLHRPPGTFLWMNDGTFAGMFLKLPATFSDLIIGGLIYSIVLAVNKKKALFAASLYLFNPITIYNSAVWGQFDAVPTMFFVLSLFFLTKKYYFYSILSVLLSLYIKFSLLPLLPLYFFLLFVYGNKKKVLVGLTIAIAVILVITFPISNMPHQWLADYVVHNGAGKNANVTSNVYNFWWLVIAPKINNPTVSASETFFGATYLVWGYVLFGLFFLPLVYAAWKVKEQILKPEHLFGIFSAVTFIFYLFLATMHERYLFPLFPLLAVYVGIKKEYLWFFIAASIIHTINLFSVWQYIPFDGSINDILTNQVFSWIMSLGMVIIGVLFYRMILRRLLFNTRDN